MPFVSKLNRLEGAGPGFQASLTCNAARKYKSCRCKQGNIVRVIRDRRTLLACLQDVWQQLQASHGQNCIDAAHALVRQQAAAAAAASRPSAPDENAMASMMHAVQIRTRLESATKRAAEANAAYLAAEKEKDAAQLAVQQLERELHACCKRARTAEQDDEPTEAAAEWYLSTFRREENRVSTRRNIAITDWQHCIEIRRGKDNFLRHPRLGLLGCLRSNSLNKTLMHRFQRNQ